jgi:hypothetical protein
MRRILVPALTISLIATTAAISAAQTITVFDNSGARAGLKVGHGGHGIDWETSIDSRSFVDFVRVRGFLGHGQWVDWDSADAGRVTRAGAAVILMRPRLGLEDVRGYVGLGIAAYLPHRVDSRTHSGVRLILGLEGSGERWTVGPEIELDVPNMGKDAAGLERRNDLLPTGRIGIAIRRRF